MDLNQIVQITSGNNHFLIFTSNVFNCDAIFHAELDCVTLSHGIQIA